MGFKVILTPQSMGDLEEIVTFIAKNNPERARTFGNELIDRALSIATLPEIGRVVPEICEPAVREIMHGSYRIIYETFRDAEAIYAPLLARSERRADNKANDMTFERG